ncbi:hypothetical protein WDZ16_13095 [Pseudokineococcus marinus]|uniref:Uncharacterized protein n=1 Tax=Pseudokineococcus marinus TaxID=351215 RepID=A0A849BSF3_9ACTN|nr:hypothetical protein [Pseudokineococcus marinus]NNH23404.1 hypothetical protein [Pseudokineococcus marinus]
MTAEAVEQLRRTRDQLAALRARWQGDADLGRLSTYAGCAADVDDVLADLEGALRDLAEPGSAR